MNKFLKYSLTIVFIFFSIRAFAETGPRVYENTGNFSYCPPLNWTVLDFPGLKYKVVIGLTGENFRENIVFVDEEYDGNLRDYVNANIVQLNSFLQDYQLIDISEFKTNSGVAGERVITNNKQQGFTIRQIFYFFQGKNKKYYVITCSVLENVATEYLPIFDESMKTFELIN